MDLVPYLSAVILVATIATILLAIGSYAAFKLRDKRKPKAQQGLKCSLRGTTGISCGSRSRSKPVGFIPSSASTRSWVSTSRSSQRGASLTQLAQTSAPESASQARKRERGREGIGSAHGATPRAPGVVPGQARPSSLRGRATHRPRRSP